MPVINLELTAVLPIDLRYAYGQDGCDSTHVLLHGCYFSEYYGYEIVAYFCDELGNRTRNGYTDAVWQSNHETYDSMVQKFAEVCLSAEDTNNSGIFPEPNFYRGY